MIENHNCSDFLNPFSQSDYKFCTKDIRVSFKTKQNCIKKCLQEYRTTVFDYSMSNSLHTSYTKIYIGFLRFDYTEIKEIPKYNIFSLISSIGGLLSLFIGLKFLSFIEL